MASASPASLAVLVLPAAALAWQSPQGLCRQLVATPSCSISARRLSTYLPPLQSLVATSQGLHVLGHTPLVPLEARPGLRSWTRCPPPQACEPTNPAKPSSSDSTESSPSSPQQPQQQPSSATKDGTDAPSRTYSSGWSGAGRFADEDPLPLSFWLFGKSPRRAILPTIAIWGVIAPLANLWGSGSFLLSLAPEAARERRLDTFYPVGSPGYPYTSGFLDYDRGFKRHYDAAGRFEFQYPSRYVQDRTVFLNNIDAAYNQRMMGPTLAGTSSRRAAPRSSGPDVAFGPAGEAGAENLSVFVGQLASGFSLRGTLGEPTEAAERLISTTIAKPGVRETTLLGASETTSARSGRPLYQFEYRVDYPSSAQQPTYTVCVVGAAKDTLFTFASRVPETVWAERADEFREVAKTFALY